MKIKKGLSARLGGSGSDMLLGLAVICAVVYCGYKLYRFLSKEEPKARPVAATQVGEQKTAASQIYGNVKWPEGRKWMYGDNNAFTNEVAKGARILEGYQAGQTNGTPR